MTKRFCDYGFTVGRLPPGPLNKITDVPGVLVGHGTIHDAAHHTGVTVILPRPQVFLHKCTAAACVLNGYGKSAGLVQIDELGLLETPIALTSTLSVGRVYDALVDYTVEQAAAAGVTVRSVNPVVGECNDGILSCITDRAAGARQFREAVATAARDFAEGSVGGGAGMICHGLKGGIGSASRVVTLDGTDYTVGVLVQANHGRLDDLTLCGRRVGPDIRARIEGVPREQDRGSCMMVVATDLPVSDRQLRRIIRRCGVGLARCGSIWGHGSGDVMLGFTTANGAEHGETRAVLECRMLNENRIEPAFAAAAEATEEAVLNALAAARPMTGRDGTVCRALAEFL
ncbi:MAG: P1 family peptidase [Gemmiger sp.]